MSPSARCAFPRTLATSERGPLVEHRRRRIAAKSSLSPRRIPCQASAWLRMACVSSVADASGALDREATRASPSRRGRLPRRGQRLRRSRRTWRRRRLLRGSCSPSSDRWGARGDSSMASSKPRSSTISMSAGSSASSATSSFGNGSRAGNSTAVAFGGAPPSSDPSPRPPSPQAGRGEREPLRPRRRQRCCPLRR